MVTIQKQKLRILVITHAFPPMNATASHRPYSWAKGWGAKGQDVHVLTTEKHPFDGSMDLQYDLTGMKLNIVSYLKRKRIARSSNNFEDKIQIDKWEHLKTLTRRVRFGLGMFADLRMLAFFPLIKKGAEIIRNNNIQAILSTYPPEVIHFAAYYLSQKFKLPWIADYRDLWFQEGRLYQFESTTAIADRINRRILKKAVLVSTVSQGLGDKLGQILDKDIIVSYNGFIEKPTRLKTSVYKENQRISIAYTGRLYPQKRDPQTFLSVFAEFLKQNPDKKKQFLIVFYGPNDPYLKSMIQRYELDECVKIHPFISFHECLKVQQQADMLLFLDWLEKDVEGILTGKLFEYLACGRPILCVGNRENTEAATIIEACGSGITLSTRQSIMKFFENVTERLPSVKPNEERIQSFSRNHQADVLMEKILEKVG